MSSPPAPASAASFTRQSPPDCVRLVVGDAKGKGLPAAQSAAAVLGLFREAAHEEDSLAAIVPPYRDQPGPPARR